MQKNLSQDTVKECQDKFGLSYHVPYAKVCDELLSFEGKDVLEVGGSLPREFVFDYLHVKSWSGIETPDYDVILGEVGGISHEGTVLRKLKDTKGLGYEDRKLTEYNVFLGNIEDLPSEYYDQYDLIFSIAAFEHIHKLPSALDKMFFALRPGGKLFSMFSPVWSAFDGHHLPNIKDKNQQHFNFRNSPIPPWGHLLMSPPQFAEYLYQYTDRETANLMTYYVYNSSLINRFFTEDYFSFFVQSYFEIDKFDLIFSHQIDDDIQSQLEELHPGRTHFSNNGILTILNKTSE